MDIKRKEGRRCLTFLSENIFQIVYSATHIPNCPPDELCKWERGERRKDRKRRREKGRNDGQERIQGEEGRKQGDIGRGKG